METKKSSDTAFEDALPNIETKQARLTGAFVYAEHMDKIIKKLMTDG